MDGDLTDRDRGTTHGGRVLVLPPGDYDRGAASRVARLVESAGTKGDGVSVALAGGSTPRPVYRELVGARKLPWRRTAIFFGDERAVPPDHPESNYRMVREALLDRLPVPPARVHRMEAERDDRDAAARDYEELLPGALDLLLLGIGTDGHTASLFPGSPALDARKRRIVAVDAPADPPGRLTVTPRVIREARRCVVLARGASKAGAVARALEGPDDPERCPAVLARGGVWILDDAAAARLDGWS